ncbi:MAG: hypothetical protein PHQ50_04635 [Eubacteriales bacterium]|nr:hypothetical protein [Eubacteriales bacterium]MDD3350196.1 hypothetical protein [Eubacteriales bacterium]
MKKGLTSIVLIMVLLMSTCFSYGAQVSKNDYYAPTGTVPDLGLVVAWPIYIDLVVSYTRISNATGTRIDNIRNSCYEHPNGHPGGAGICNGRLKQSFDNGSFSSVNVSSFPTQTIILPSPSTLFWSFSTASSRVFRQKAIIKTETSFANYNASIIYNPNRTTSVTINH